MSFAILVLAALAALIVLPRALGRPLSLAQSGGVAALLIAAWAAYAMVLVVPPGQAAVEVFLGSVRPEARRGGLHLANPFSQFEFVSVRRASVDFTPNGGDAPSVAAVTADRNVLTVDASFPFQIAPEHLPKLYQRVGRGRDILDTLVIPAARAAVRGSVVRFGWAEATVERRAEVAQAMQAELEAAVADSLQRFGFTPAEARSAVVFAPVLLRDIRPDPKVLNAVSEKVAAEEDLKRQRILTDIARQEAERRANEGLGVARLFGELPQGFTPEQIRTVLAALADKSRADALMKAVETGKVSVMVVPGTTAVALPASP